MLQIHLPAGEHRDQRAGPVARSPDPAPANGWRLSQPAASDGRGVRLQRSTHHGCAETGDVAAEPKGMAQGTTTEGRTGAFFKFLVYSVRASSWIRVQFLFLLVIAV